MNVPDWRAAQLRAAATTLAQGLSDSGLATLAAATNSARDSATGDDRTELGIVASAHADETARRKNTVVERSDDSLQILPGVRAVVAPNR